MHHSLGKTYRCKITGFTGVATGRCEYLTGCNQILLLPKVGADGAAKDGSWIDEQRLECLDVETITLDNGKTPGFGQTPPTSGRRS